MDAHPKAGGEGAEARRGEHDGQGRGRERRVGQQPRARTIPAQRPVRMTRSCGTWLIILMQRKSRQTVTRLPDSELRNAYDITTTSRSNELKNPSGASVKNPAGCSPNAMSLTATSSVNAGSEIHCATLRKVASAPVGGSSSAYST